MCNEVKIASALLAGNCITKQSMRLSMVAGGWHRRSVTIARQPGGQNQTLSKRQSNWARSRRCSMLQRQDKMIDYWQVSPWRGEAPTPGNRTWSACVRIHPYYRWRGNWYSCEPFSEGHDTVSLPFINDSTANSIDKGGERCFTNYRKSMLTYIRSNIHALAYIWTHALFFLY